MKEGEVSFIAREGKKTPLGSLPNVKTPSQENSSQGGRMAFRV
jgi:hypothetical protein